MDSWEILKSILKLTLLSTVLLILVSILEAVLTFFVQSPFLSVIIGTLVLSMLVYVYGGYSAIKKYKLGWKSAALVGFITAFVYTVIDSIVIMLFVTMLNAPLLSAMFGTMINMSNETMKNPSPVNPVMQAGLKGIPQFILMVIMPFVLIVRFLINIFVGTVLSVVGALVAQRTKPKQTSSRSRS